MKPNDNFKYKITQLKTFAEKLTKFRISVREDNESLFTRNGKLKTGQQCAHTFNENCMGLLQTLDNKIQDLLKTMQNAESKHTRMYPFANTATASKKRRQKENKKESQTKEKWMGREKLWEGSFLIIKDSSYANGNPISDPLAIKKDAVLNLKKRDCRYLNQILNHRFSEELAQLCKSLNPHLLDIEQSDSDSDWGVTGFKCWKQVLHWILKKLVYCCVIFELGLSFKDVWTLVYSVPCDIKLMA